MVDTGTPALLARWAAAASGRPVVLAPSDSSTLALLCRTEVADLGRRAFCCSPFLSRPYAAGCLDQCEHGPNIVVYPEVRGTVTVRVKAPDREALWKPDGKIEFEFAGGSVNGVSYGEYPPLRIGERYLVFFQLHPAGTRWYPNMPFRIDEAGRLDQVEFISPSPYLWKSLINGMKLDDVVKGLQKR